MKTITLVLTILTFLSLSFADDIYDGAESMVASGALLKRSNVKMLTKQELKILIKVVDARHGKTYNNFKLNNFFRSRDWYTPGGYSKSKLSIVDKANTRTLKAVMMTAPTRRDNQISLDNAVSSVASETFVNNSDVSIEPVVGNGNISGNVIVSKPVSQTPKLRGSSSRYLSLNKTTFLAGEKIRINTIPLKEFDKNAFFSIIPSNVDHGHYNLNYSKAASERMHLYEKRNDKLNLYMPFVPGNYDIRFTDKTRNQEEVFSVSIVVQGVSGKGPALMLDKKTFRSGEIAVVRFIAKDNFEPKAWVGIVPSKIGHGNEKLNDNYDLSYKYLKMADSGVLYFRVPSSAGRYDFRMNENDNGGREVAYISFKVVR